MKKLLFLTLVTLCYLNSFSQDCTYAGQTYGPGSVVCMEGKAYRCNQGTWEYTGIDCGNTVSESSIVKTASTSAIKKMSFTTGSKVAPCVNFFSTSVGHVGMRNNCPKCVVAVVQWSNVGTLNYQIAGYSQIDVPLASSYGQLIGEQPCP